MNTCRILLASGNRQQRSELRAVLESGGHQVDETETATGALRGAHSGIHQLVIFDSDFDYVKASDFCRTVGQRSNLGIMVLGGNGSRQELIDALNAGADDYLTPPFVRQELLARVRAVGRRVRTSDEASLVVLHDRAIDMKAHEIRGPGSSVTHLTPKEFLVLQCLVGHSPKPFTCRQLARTIWHREGTGEMEYVRAVIRQLKKKIEPDSAQPRYILTERTVGYRFPTPTRVGEGDLPVMGWPLLEARGSYRASRNDNPAKALSK